MEKLNIVLPVHFFSAGQFISSPGWAHQRRCLDSSVIFIVQKGRFFMWEDDNRIELCAGDAVILRAGHAHHGEPVAPGEQPVYYWAHFLWESEAAPGQTAITLNQKEHCANPDKVMIFLHQLINESRSHMDLPISCDYLMSLILIQLIEQEREQNSIILYNRIQEFLCLNYRQNITLQQLTHTFPYSTDYMSRVFKKNAGVSIRKYQHILRLTEAKRRLLTTLDTVRMIAGDCGYTNEKFFITTFTRYEGVSPTQYRNLFSKLHQNGE